MTRLLPRLVGIGNAVGSGKIVVVTRRGSGSETHAQLQLQRQRRSVVGARHTVEEALGRRTETFAPALGTRFAAAVVAAVAVVAVEAQLGAAAVVSKEPSAFAEGMLAGAGS